MSEVLRLLTLEKHGSFFTGLLTIMMLRDLIALDPHSTLSKLEKVALTRFDRLTS